jgi:hypothetical protein
MPAWLSVMWPQLAVDAYYHRTLFVATSTKTYYSATRNQQKLHSIQNNRQFGISVQIQTAQGSKARVKSLVKSMTDQQHQLQAYRHYYLKLIYHPLSDTCITVAWSQAVMPYN